MAKIECPNYGTMTGGIPLCKAFAMRFCAPVAITQHESDPTATRLDPDAERDCHRGYSVTVVAVDGRHVPLIHESDLPKSG